MGVSTHSEPKKVFIFSAYRSNRSQDENEGNHQQVVDYFTKMSIPFIPVIGRYKGVLEEGFLVTAASVPEELVLHMTRHYHQDEYMVLDNHKHGTYIASLVNCATREQKQIGFMREMPEADVQSMNLDYTYRPDLKKYWVVWHTDTTQMQKLADEKSAYIAQHRQGRLPSGEEPFGTPAYC